MRPKSDQPVVWQIVPTQNQVRCFKNSMSKIFPLKNLVFSQKYRLAWISYTNLPLIIFLTYKFKYTVNISIRGIAFRF